MPDDLDDKLRGAMKTLDDQVPSGYFDALPNQILARLEDGSMQQGSSTSMTRDKRDLLTGPPVAATPAPKTEAKTSERSEDSGLHDIRNLAQSTKQRLSSRRSTQNPPISDEDLLASSSGSWKHVALPEPAKMVSLPSIAELPPMAEVIAADKKARAKKDKTAPPPTHDEVLAPIATANAALDSLTAKPAVIPERQAFSLPSQQNKRSKGPLLAVLGLGAAAAAGGLIFMQMNKDEKAPAASASENTVAAAEPAKAAEPAPPPAPAPAVEAVAAGSAAEEPEVAAAEEPAEEAEPAADSKADKPTKRSAKGKKSVTKDEPEEEVKVEEKKPEPKTEPKVEPKKAAGGEGEPSFDALLKEAGVEEKKEAKPKLEKKSLTGEDFKKGMGGIASKAQGCYKGTQGTAMVKLTVAPSGKVTKVSVGGAFAGKPEGACVEAAVKSASFPPWDGGPQSFSYSYMLAD